MALGALLLEGDNSEFWVGLGCLSNHNALKQHALIRGLQLNVSLAVAWAFLGKVLSSVITLNFSFSVFFSLYCFSWTFYMSSLLMKSLFKGKGEEKK